MKLSVRFSFRLGSEQERIVDRPAEFHGSDDITTKMRDNDKRPAIFRRRSRLHRAKPGSPRVRSAFGARTTSSSTIEKAACRSRGSSSSAR